jgi:hypothetical protein
MGLAAIALPPLLLARILRTNLGKGVSPRLVATTLPFIMVYVTAWTLGEMVGYWFGAGDSLALVR